MQGRAALNPPPADCIARKVVVVIHECWNQQPAVSAALLADAGGAAALTLFHSDQTPHEELLGCSTPEICRSSGMSTDFVIIDSPLTNHTLFCW